MTEPVTIGVGANKWVKDSNTRMVTLYSALPQSVYSFHEAGTSTDYQVPVGKKFILLNCDVGVGRVSSNTNIYMDFYKGTIPDSLSGAFLIARARAGVNDTGQAGIHNQNMPTYVEIEAGNYITQSFEYHAIATIIGIETNV